MKRDSNSAFVRHEPCKACGSKDNLSRYDDGHGYCHGCGAYEHSTGEVKMALADPSPTVTKQAVLSGTVTGIRDRRIDTDTCKKYGVTTECASGTNDISKHHYPYYNNDGHLLAVKTRVVKDKSFFSTGKISGAGLFGQHLFKPEGKYITVVEGELDCLSAYEMLGSKWPVVSIPNGSNGAKAAIQSSLEYLECFENVVLCFDMDEAGRKAARECAEVLSPNKARIVTLEDYKDASEYLMANKIKDFSSQWWNARPFVMTGVITLADAWESFIDRGKQEILPFPKAFGKLNTMLNGGVAGGEITVLGALTSVGKTTLVNEITYGLWQETDVKIGCAFLEADSGEAVENLLTIHTGQNISLLDRDNLDYAGLRTDIIDDGRIFLLDHRGAINADEMFLKLRSMVKGNGVQVLIIDPLQAAVVANNNEVIDDFMDRLLKLAKETGVSIIIVSHMKKPSMNSPHNVSEYDLKGSGSINQIAFNTILLSRDKMAEDDYTRNSTMVQVVKCRRTGQTGMAGWLHYVHETGRLEEGQPPETNEAENYKGEF